MAKTTRKTNAKTTGSASGGEVKSKPSPDAAPAKKATAKKAGVKKATAKKTAVKQESVKKAAGDKTVSKKAAAKKAAGAARKSPAASRAGSTATPPRISSQQRHQMIEQAAYLRAESLGFCSDPKEDWLSAEAEVDARLAEAGITVSG